MTLPSEKATTMALFSVDLDQRKPIDLLPDRETKTLETWLKNHSGIEIVTRDRSSAYVSAITSACPDAIQPGDRSRG